MELSVIICTHNAPINRLQCVLAALKDQTLALNRWELIIVDNASDYSVRDSIDLSWHRNSRVIREDRLGLTLARLSGIDCSTNEILIFVDDDNVLDPEYLSSAHDLFLQKPELGACSGNAFAEFETTPPSWVDSYTPFLGIRRVDHPIFTKHYFDWRAMPIGAGLCVRRAVAVRYASSCQESSIRTGLDRRGRSLASGGDSDLAMTALDLQLEMGISPNLSLRHLIPTERCSEDYVVRLMEGITFSGLVLQSLRGVTIDGGRRTLSNSLFRFASHTKAVLTLKGVDRKVYFARLRGEVAFRNWCLMNRES